MGFGMEATGNYINAATIKAFYACANELIKLNIQHNGRGEWLNIYGKNEWGKEEEEEGQMVDLQLLMKSSGRREEAETEKTHKPNPVSMYVYGYSTNRKGRGM